MTAPTAAGDDAPVLGDSPGLPNAPPLADARSADDATRDDATRDDAPALREAPFTDASTRADAPTRTGASSLAGLVARARERFARAGIAADEAAADAEVLARHVLMWDRATYLARRRDPAPPGFEAGYAPLAARRAQREPVSLITGRREFWGLTFEVDRAVLAPRPETELIVETALALFGDRREAPLTIADVGAGSGCLAVTLAREFPRAMVTAVDVSPDALAVARTNAAAHGVAGRIVWVESPLADWLAGLAPDGGGARSDRGGAVAEDGRVAAEDGRAAPARGAAAPGDKRAAAEDGRAATPRGTARIDLLVANLPYVPTGELDGLPPEVRLHEPEMALDGGPDGLDPLRELLAGLWPQAGRAGSLPHPAPAPGAAPTPRPGARAGLKPDGRVIVEIGAGQADALRRLVAATPGAELLRLRPDLQGIPRTAVIAAARP